MAELEKNYNPEIIERKWYEFWISRSLFTADPGASGEPFTIVIPPPNVTGTLHMGHALNATLQDILIRWKRMSGYNVLWVPGMDHAGIATQNVVERQLTAEKTDRHQFGREKFIERVWTWKNDYGGRIINQLKRLGSSCDWSRERFTLDEGLSKAVNEVFVALYEQGLIYRDNRLINWCPRCLTALSDIEVEHEDVEGKLTQIRYPFSDKSGYIIVATTRPETMLGDAAVAVNPDDERYQDVIGKTIDLPLTGRQIAVIADVSVDPSFGTGAVKVTPSHDFNDEATAKRQSPTLPYITVIALDGTMTKDAGNRYAGMDRYTCRKAVMKDLLEMDLIEKQDKHSHAISQCYRCKTVIEPLPALQWYVKVGPLAEKAMDAVRSGQTTFVPKSWENTYFAWMEHIKDWCISRQIWWGHRIPAWHCDCGGMMVCRREPEKCDKCGNIELKQDNDVLDTWFSSALWPFSTLGWPEETPELKRYYPTAVLVTGFDIIFFWVARMMMMGIHFMKEVPFRNVYIHALVRDASGQKMSKSKGNVIDPLVMMDKYGTDAFRFTLAMFAAQGRDVKFSEERVEGYRHFVNKLWNAARFILANTAGSRLPAVPDMKQLDVGSRWIVSRLSAASDDVHSALEDYRFNDAAGSMYSFVWHELCDWYIEMVKPLLYGEEEEGNEAVKECLLYLLDSTLRLLHPFMPYVTEEIWQTMPHEGDSIVTAFYPRAIPKDASAETQMEVIMETVMAIRTIRGELTISPSVELRALVKTHTGHARDILAMNILFLKKLSRSDIEQIGADIQKPKNSSVAVRTQVEVYVPLEGLLDLDREIERINKEMAKLEETARFLSKKLNNRDFVDRAPAVILSKEKGKYEDCMRKMDRVKENLQKMLELKGAGA